MKNLEKIKISFILVLIQLQVLEKMVLLCIIVQKKKVRNLNKRYFLCDSGGQYKYGTTDVTRTICFLIKQS